MTDRERIFGFKKIFNEAIDEAGSICILGHIGPDGDCIGSALAVRSYIEERKKKRGQGLKELCVYLEEASDKFAYLKGFDGISHDTDALKAHELCIVLDCGDLSRLGKFLPYLKLSEKAVCVDHHITNDGFTELSLVEPEASSTSELVFDLFEEEYMTRALAEAVYTGIVHDTGVFRYSCTSPHTMEIAGKCMSYGIDFGDIIDDSFFSMTIDQKAVLGRVLLEMETYLDGRFVLGHIDAASMELHNVTNKDMDGIIDQLRTTRGALGAAFLYQCKNRSYKVSLRSNCDKLNVAGIAALFGGGGHIRAAGCFMGPDLRSDIKKIIDEVTKQIGSDE